MALTTYFRVPMGAQAGSTPLPYPVVVHGLAAWLSAQKVPARCTPGARVREYLSSANPRGQRNPLRGEITSEVTDETKTKYSRADCAGDEKCIGGIRVYRVLVN